MAYLIVGRVLSGVVYEYQYQKRRRPEYPFYHHQWHLSVCYKSTHQGSGPEDLQGRQTKSRAPPHGKDLSEKREQEDEKEPAFLSRTRENRGSKSGGILRNPYARCWRFLHGKTDDRGLTRRLDGVPCSSDHTERNPNLRIGFEHQITHFSIGPKDH